MALGICKGLILLESIFFMESYSTNTITEGHINVLQQAKSSSCSKQEIDPMSDTNREEGFRTVALNEWCYSDLINRDYDSLCDSFQ